MTPWTATHQSPLSSPISQSFLRFMSIESVMLSNHLIFCCSLLLLPSILSSISVFSSESALHMRWPKYLLSPPDTSTTEHHFHIGTAASFFLELLVIAVCSPPIAYFRPGEGGGIHLLVSYFLPFHIVHGVLAARILEWFAIPSSSGSRCVRTLHYYPSILSGSAHTVHSFTELHKQINTFM